MKSFTISNFFILYLDDDDSDNDGSDGKMNKFDFEVKMNLL